MSKFTLKQVTSGKFRVMMNGIDTIGSISVEPEQVDELLKNWSGQKDLLVKAKDHSQQSSRNPFVNAIMKARAREVSREFILRGC